MSEEGRGLSKHLDSVREQLKEAEADRGRLAKQAVLLKEQLRESQVRERVVDACQQACARRGLCEVAASAATASARHRPMGPLG